MSQIVKLKDVRLSFAHLWRARSYEEDSPAKFEATLLVPNDHVQLSTLKTTIRSVIAEKWGETKSQDPKFVKSLKLWCLRDGDDKEYDDYTGHQYVHAASVRRPVVIDRDKSPLVESDGRPYSGCYVNANVEIWATTHAKGGKQVNAGLLGLQFLRDGEAFSGGAIGSADDFDEVDEAAMDAEFDEDTKELAEAAEVDPLS